MPEGASAGQATGQPEPEMRRRVLEAVLAYPGLHVRALARLLDTAPSLIDYHADGLLDGELITEATYEGYRRIYPRPGPAAPELRDSEWIALLRDPIPLQVALLLLDSDGTLAHKALAEAVSVAKSTLSFHLNKMAEAKFVVRDGAGAYRLADALRVERLVVRFPPPPDLLALQFALWLRTYRRAR